jgi:hypothetical protein
MLERLRVDRQIKLAAAAAALALLVGAPTAKATYDPVGGGTTKLRLAGSFLRALKAQGVRVSADAPATVKHGVAVFPAVAGEFDPTTGNGTVEHEGAIRLSAAGKTIPIKALKLRSSQRAAPFLAKVGGGQFKLGTTKSVRATRRGFDERIQVSTLSLTAKTATRLGKKLGKRDLFRQGLKLGSAVTEVSPETVTLLQRGSVTLDLDPGFSQKLQSLFVAVNPVFPAEHAGAGFNIPIFGGDMSLDASSGRITTQGSLEFIQLAERQVFWNEPWFDLGGRALNSGLDVEPSPPFRGHVESALVGPTALSGPTEPSPAARSIGVRQSLTMDAGTAAVFNEAFAKPQGKDGVFAAGEAIGSLAFVASGE